MDDRRQKPRVNIDIDVEYNMSREQSWFGEVSMKKTLEKKTWISLQEDRWDRVLI
ncbi:MAG: hypothetical protein JXB88_11335 [Spirochaetales bacterium]|nr:hypothetical protein [Spirochaetales bacterium]